LFPLTEFNIARAQESLGEQQSFGSCGDVRHGWRNRDIPCYCTASRPLYIRMISKPMQKFAAFAELLAVGDIA
jgi:hypothetical protein